MIKLNFHLIKAACISFTFLQVASLQTTTTTTTISKNYSTIPNTQTVELTTKPLNTQIDPITHAQSSQERSLKTESSIIIDGTIITAEPTFQSGILQEEDFQSASSSSTKKTSPSLIKKDFPPQLLETVATTDSNASASASVSDENTFTSSSFPETSSLFTSTNADVKSPIVLENITSLVEKTISLSEKSTILPKSSIITSESSSLVFEPVFTPNNGTTSTIPLKISTPTDEKSTNKESTVPTEKSSLKPENNFITTETVSTIPIEIPTRLPEKSSITYEESTHSAVKWTIPTETSTIILEKGSLASETLSIASKAISTTPFETSTTIPEKSTRDYEESTVPSEENNSHLNVPTMTYERSITSVEKNTRLANESIIKAEFSTTTPENSFLASETLFVTSKVETSTSIVETSPSTGEESIMLTEKSSLEPKNGTIISENNSDITEAHLATTNETASTTLIERSVTSTEKSITLTESNTSTITTETSTITPESRSFSNGISPTTPVATRTITDQKTSMIAEKSTFFFKNRITIIGSEESSFANTIPAFNKATLSGNTTKSSSTKTVGTVAEIDKVSESMTASSTSVEPQNTFKIAITANITNRFLVAEISTTVVNTDDAPKEVELSWILSQDAYISGFAIEINGTIYDGYVREKSEGDRIYSKAKKKRMNAAKIATSDLYESNKFMTTENIEPNQTMIVRLTYEQLLQRTNGRYEVKFMIPPLLDLAPVQSTIKVNINETRPIKILHTCFKHQDQISCESPHQSARYIDKNDNKNAAIKVRYPPEDGLIMTETGGEFIIWYDVDRDISGGEVLVHDGYFVHFFSPDDLEPIPKFVIFIIDSSGSMKGHKLEQLKKAMGNILFELKEQEDLFQIIDFNTGVRVWDVESGNVAYENLDDHWGSDYDKDPALDTSVNVLPTPFLADEKHKRNAKRIIENLEAYGATNTQLALDIGLLLALEHALEAGNKSRQAMIIFLTDGEATIGETSRENIISTVTKSNSKLRVPIFSLSFGDEADRDLVRELSRKNFGLSRHIFESADSSLQIENFYNEISSPLLRDVTFRYVDADWKKLTKNNFGLFFQGSELIVAGKTGGVNDGASSSKINNVTVSARTGDGSISYFNSTPQLTSAEATSKIERIWAYMTLRLFLDAKRISPNVTYYDREALKLSLKYSFVSPVSVMVVVKPDNSESAIELQDFLTEKSKNDDDTDPIIKQPPLFDYEIGDFETQELEDDKGTRTENYFFKLIKSLFSRLRSIFYGDETKTLTMSIHKEEDSVKSNICKYFHKICSRR